MKKIKNIFFCIAVLGLIPMFCGCDKPIEVKQLSTPTNIYVANNKIFWEDVQNADYYEVFVNGETYQVRDNELGLNMFTAPGKYQISIVAFSKSKFYEKSVASQMFEYDNREPLSSPADLKINKQTGKISWKKVQNAINYVLLVNDSQIVVTSENYKILSSNVTVDLQFVNNYVFSGKENILKVACAETSRYKASEQSNQISYVITGEHQKIENVRVANTNEGLVLMFDELETATNGYTYFVDDSESGILIAGSNSNISAKINGFGNHKIELLANEVLAQNGEKIFNNSVATTIQFENVPNFVNKQVENIKISKQTLEFDVLEDATQYDISISRKVFDDEQEVANFSVSRQEFVSNFKKIDISEHTTQVGKYFVKILPQYISGNINYEGIETVDSSLKVAQVLDVPSFSIQNTGATITIGFENVQYAKSLLVFLNDELSPVLTVENTLKEQNLFANLSKTLLKSGDNQIYAKAVGDKDLFFDSGYSKSLIYKIAQINVPNNLKVANDVLTFNYVGDYEKFLIYINDVQVGEAEQAEYQLNLSKTGKYKICVSAMYQGSEGAASNSVTYKITEQLKEPTNLKVEGKILTFDGVENAIGYNVYITNSIHNEFLALSRTNLRSISLQDAWLANGNNQIVVKAIGDNDLYFDSNLSEIYTFKISNTIPEVRNIVATIENEKYVLSFDGVSQASSYIVEIISPSEESNTINNIISTTVDIDRYMTEPGEYKFNVVAVSANNEWNNSIVEKTMSFDTMFNRSYYESKNFFYDGHSYSYVFNDRYSLEDFVLYAVMYGIDEAKVYIDNSNSAFDLQNNRLKSYLPCLSNYGVDFSGGNDVAQALTPLIIASLSDSSKLSNAIKLIERAHDQLYLYFDVDDTQTTQTNASQNANVYTIKLIYQSGFKTEATDNHQKQMAGLYDVDYRTDFAIDSLQKTAPVETVDQLLMVVQSGRKPQFVTQDSIAEKTYLYAKNVLSKICNGSMSDAEKAIAIHDWIVQNNTYANDTYEAASGEPFSIENLDDMSFYASGMLLYHYSVCRGYAQAFSLMCNIEGIETIETFGLVGGGLDYSKISFASSNILSTVIYLYQNQSKLQNIGAHSWNRINIDIGNGKKWYIVDPTWDDPDSASFEKAVKHEYMFVNDEFVKTGRKEFFPNGELYHRTDIYGVQINYSATDSLNYYDFANTKAQNIEMLDTIVSKLKFQDTLSLYCEESITQQDIITAMQNNSIDYLNFEIYVYGSKYAYIYKK